MKALVIGGTGPTGPALVSGLVARRWKVEVLHRGTHESDELPPEVPHIHANPFDDAELAMALAGRTYDLVLATYGRIRDIARLLEGRTGRFVAIGGAPLYRGYMLPQDCFPQGLPVPTPEDATRIANTDELRKGYMILATEEAVFAHHPTATVLRYPIVYGPRQPAPREWCIVRRVLDRRPHIVLADGGLTLDTRGYVDNLAHAVLLAVDRPEASAGQAYNCGDERMLTLRQLAEWIARILGHDWEIVSVPCEAALPARPLLMHVGSHHRVLDLTKIRTELGYRDVVPTEEALRRTVQWLVENRPQPGGIEETILQDPFDYQAEDRLVRMQREALERMRALDYANPPGPGLTYIAPEHRSAKRGGWAPGLPPQNG